MLLLVLDKSIVLNIQFIIKSKKAINANKELLCAYKSFNFLIIVLKNKLTELVSVIIMKKQ
jgi:hypothetical protein